MAVKPKLQISFRERDLGLGHILKEAAKLRKKPFVKAGVVQARGSKLREDGKKTVADIAQIHEYGAPAHGIPERSFLRSTRNKNEGKYKKLISRLGEMIFNPEDGMTVEKALGVIGQQFSADVKNTIRNNEAGLHGPTALKASTIRRKNAGKIEKAQGTVNRLEKKTKLSKGDKTRLHSAQDLIDTGGASVPLIDTAQLVNSLSYEVDMNDAGEGSGGHE